MEIPFVDLKAQYVTIKPEIENAIELVKENGKNLNRKNFRTTIS